MPGQAQPVGASVVAGQAQVSTAGATTLINQATAKAIINWQDFSVPAGTAVPPIISQSQEKVPA